MKLEEFLELDLKARFGISSSEAYCQRKTITRYAKDYERLTNIRELGFIQYIMKNKSEEIKIKNQLCRKCNTQEVYIGKREEFDPFEYWRICLNCLDTMTDELPDHRWEPWKEWIIGDKI